VAGLEAAAEVAAASRILNQPKTSALVFALALGAPPAFRTALAIVFLGLFAGTLSLTLGFAFAGTVGG